MKRIRLRACGEREQQTQTQGGKKDLGMIEK